MFRIPYAKTIAGCAALATAMLLATLVLTHTGPAKPRPAPRPQLDDGTTNEAIREAIKPGNYATAINVHNPSPVYPVTLYVKAVQDSGKPSGFKSVTLDADFAREVDCTDISTLLDHTAPDYTSTTFTKGFVVIFATGPTSVAAAPLLLPLDVVGVYTAEPPSVTIANPTSGTQPEIPGIALHMLTIEGRLEIVPAAVNGATLPLPAGRYLEYAAKFLCGYLPIPTT